VTSARATPWRRVASSDMASNPPAPTFPISLADGWRVSADQLQWVLQSYKKPKWRAAAYVGSTKAVLIRVIAEEGVILTDDAKRALNRLPARFSA
jgi:hypothetical protein